MLLDGLHTDIFQSLLKRTVCEGRNTLRRHFEPEEKDTIVKVIVSLINRKN